MVYRFSVPVDDQWHRIELAGPVVHVDCRRSDIVEFWAIESKEPARQRYFRVFGTGQPVPDDLTYIGTALTPAVAPLSAYGGLVWHLFERTNGRAEA
jgi:hypothetical protein